ncbi:hypothetical protein PLESTB_001495000 [Pleodorina starrii]|uniref:Uncharacterized protein n=1 Tax=Pleodorina starrii TaxID=330485 RepID=A0A9W6BW38_9CHLO|nr:hypothetical protein PLESTM_001449400 [Pleodorina starrii]GLC59509.1 hypothetical protein PLESTB_001495000 [Pleodorina starrii]GLC66288.1 hypothetical protein PLESTF_000407800 [Pleodorina starrii]
MDKGLRVVGFTFSNHGESTLNAEVSNAKLQTQRSLLSELLAIHASDEGFSIASESQDSTDDEDDEYVEEPTPVARADTFVRSQPITIPCPESLARQRAKDAYRRLVDQRRVEHLYYQQQQQLQYQAQQQLLLQQQQRLRLQQQQLQAAAPKHEAGQGHNNVQSRGHTSTVPVY